MPKIPVYQAGQLASENVGVPRSDQSGVITAEALTRLAGTAYNLINEQVAKQKQAKEQLDVSAARTQYQVQYIKAKQEITADPNITSEVVESVLNERSQKISGDLISALPDGATRQATQAAIQLDQDAYKIDAAKERAVLANKEAYNKWFNTVDLTINDMKDAGSPDAYAATVAGFKGMQAAIVPLVGDNLESAQKATQNAIDAATTQFVAGGIEKGREDMLQQMQVLGKFNEASDAVQQRLDKTLQTALQTKEYRANITTAFQTLNDNVDMVESIRAGDKSLSDIEHDLVSTQYELKTGNFSESQKKDLERRIDTLDALRTAQLTGAAVRGTDHPDVVTDLKIEAANLIKQSDGEKNLAEGVYLSDLKKYQDRLVSEFVDKQNISGKTFNALYADVYGVMLKDLSQKTFEQQGAEKWFNFTPGATKDVLPAGERRPLFEIFNAAKREDGSVDPKVMFRAYDEFLNDKKAGKTVGDSLSPEQAKEYFNKASLTYQGISGVLNVGDFVATKAGPRKVTSFVHGVPQVEEQESDRQAVRYFKQFKTGGGR